jgi:hypothetical protein
VARVSGKVDVPGRTAGALTTGQARPVPASTSPAAALYSVARADLPTATPCAL